MININNNYFNVIKSFDNISVDPNDFDETKSITGIVN